MSKNVTQPRQAAGRQRPEVEAGHNLPTHSTASLRVDEPHDGGVHDPEADLAREDAAPEQDARRDSVTSGTALGPTEDELLLQASQIAEHLRSRFAELDRREQTLNAQSAEFDQDRRSFRFRARQAEEELNERESKLCMREAELTQRLNACEQLTTETRHQRQRLLEQRQALDAERVEMQKTLAESLDDERRQLAQEKEGWERKRQDLDAERVEMRKTLAESLEEERRQLVQEQEGWQRQRNAALAELERKRQINDVSIRESQQQLAAHRQRQLQQIERQQKKFEQEQTLHQKRMHFHEAHLKKTRQDLESVRNALRLERQQLKDRSVQAEATLRMRRLQLDHYRALLEQRERSLQRERELLEKCRRARQEEIQGERRRLQLERQNWERQQQVEQDERRRREAALAEQTKSVDRRASRLNELQRELEEDHRNALEMRLALEQAWADFSEQAGADVILARVDHARNDLADLFSRSRETLARQRQDLLDVQSRLHEQWEEFHRERRTLTEWMSERDAQLNIREEQLSEQVETLETREAAWRTAREQWQHERLQAEHVIGDLLRELTEANFPLPRETSRAAIAAALRTTTEDRPLLPHTSPGDNELPPARVPFEAAGQAPTDSPEGQEAPTADATVTVIDPRD